MAEETGQHEAWLSLREAARTLGISEKSVRRRIQAGTLRGRRVDGPYGPAWHILVSRNGHSPSTVDTSAVQGAGSQPRTVDSGAVEGVWSQPSTVDGPAEVGAGSTPRTVDGPTEDGGPPVLLEALRVIERQQQTIMELSGRCGYLQAQLAEFRECIPALEALVEPAERPRPWWRFW